MKTSILILLISALLCMQNLNAQIPESDAFMTSEGELKIYFVGHGTLYFEFNQMVIHVDPYSRVADYSKLPKADLVLITHEHRDHLDMNALNAIRKEKTQILLTEICFSQINEGYILRNGESKYVLGMKIEAVPAYNILNLRENGQPYHPKGNGNGYIINFGDTRVYVAGDTEHIPEMASLKNIDIAFLPMNLPFTMTPEMVAEAAKVFKPEVLYPYHFGNTDTGKLLDLLSDTPEIEVRIRKF
jgi:L-ascorbate metabolism protein UlaG (beta-lactamase superfamily)